MTGVERPESSPVRPAISRQRCIARNRLPMTAGRIKTKRLLVLLDRLPPPMRVAILALLNRGSRGKRFASPKDWKPATAEMMVGAIVDAVLALADYRYPVSNIQSLASLEALKIICNRVLDGLWSEINLVRILIAIKQIHRVEVGSAPGHLTRMINRHKKKARRRNQWHLVRPPSDYIRGGVAVFAFGEIATAAGKEHRGRSLRRDGALLAVAAETNLRLGEYHSADQKRVRMRSDAKGEYAEINIPSVATKHGIAVTGVVYDLDALALLKAIREEASCEALLGNGRGGRLARAGVGQSLRRPNRLAWGEPTTANLLRRSGVTSETTAAGKALRLNKGQGGRTGQELLAYNGSMAERGHRAIKAGLACYVRLPETSIPSEERS